MKPLEKLREDVLCLLESSNWKEVKPSSPRAAEYFVQAIGDMKRCLGNLDRMEMAENKNGDNA